MLTAYLDGELGSQESGTVIRHLEICADCSALLRDYYDMGRRMRALPAVEPPPELALRLRVEASHYSVRGQRWVYWKLRWAAAIRAMALPTAVGTVAALVLFTALVGGVELPVVNAAMPVVSLSYGTPPRLTYPGIYSVDSPVLVQAQVDSSGHVYGYRVLSGPANAQIIDRLNNQLFLSVFQPATTASGQPTNGSVLVSFGTVNVRG